ncbi:MAG: FAD-dependent oxidoreductase [Rhizomicrobium sp.]
MSDDDLECDLLVIGAGMAGLSAGAWAAERGASVIVVEKAPDIGGSAMMSTGVLWTATSPERMALHSGGRPDLGRVVVANYSRALDWMRSRDIAISRAMRVLFGRGYQIDVIGHLRGCARIIEQRGGMIARETVTRSLSADVDGRVVGARTGHRDGDVDIRARWTLLATGGYQGSAPLRGKYIHPNARDMLHRSNLFSTGDGLTLGAGAGGEVRGTNRGFYGHLVSESPAWGDPRLFTVLTQYHSEFGVLVNMAGRRFCDESLGDHTNANHTLAQSDGRALCIWDARVHAENATRSVTATGAAVDKMATALRHGGRGIVADTPGEIAAFAGFHGFDGAQTLRTIEAYNAGCAAGWEKLSPPRVEHFGALDKAPFYALIVRPAITFTNGGLTINASTQILRADGWPVRGLLAAGSDAGDVFGLGYCGGLAMAVGLGIAAARTAGFGE